MPGRHLQIPSPAAAELPIAALNTTPLIDVLLVLLIMFIVTIPTATHKVTIPLPQAGPPPPEPPATHRIDLGAGGDLAWDGVPLAAGALPGRLAAFRARRPDGLLELRADAAARYESFDRLMAMVKRSGIARLAFIDNERFARIE
jgi:biopolymer transport protein ExbD